MDEDLTHVVVNRGYVFGCYEGSRFGQITAREWAGDRNAGLREPSYSTRALVPVDAPVTIYVAVGDADACTAISVAARLREVIAADPMLRDATEAGLRILAATDAGPYDCSSST